MKFETMGIFPKEQEPQKEKQENKEKMAEEIAEERGGLFSRVIKRFLEEREEGAKEVSEMSEDQKRIYELAKKTPLLRGYMVAAEGFFGAEPGKRLNTKESLIKAGTGMVMFTSDILKLIEKAKTGKAPENVFRDKTFDWFEHKIEENQQKDPKSESAEVLETVYDFLKENKEAVDYYEDRLGGIAKGEQMEKQEMQG